MENSSHYKLLMYLAVKAVCDAKPAVWQRSVAFADAYTDFCVCIENIFRSSPDDGICRTAANSVAVEYQVADTILTKELDELIERFEPVDVVFVDDYTAARSVDLTPAAILPVPALPVA